MVKFKVRKPHDDFMKEFCLNDSATIKNVGSGLYLKKMIKDNHLDDLHVKTIRNDTFLLFGTKKPKVKRELVKYTIFEF